MRILILVTFFITSVFASAQNNRLALLNPITAEVAVEGFILDGENNEAPLAFATVLIKETGKEITTTIEGSFTTKLRPGVYQIEVAFIGYETKLLSSVHVMQGKPLVLKTSLKALRLEVSPDFDALFSDNLEN